MIHILQCCNNHIAIFVSTVLSYILQTLNYRALRMNETDDAVLCPHCMTKLESAT